MRCPNCGHENDTDSKFCKNCGRELPQYDFAKEAFMNAQRIRRLRMNVVTNRILLIASIISLVLVFVSVFLPVLVRNTSSYTHEYGGFAWFIKLGWDALNKGQIAIGPFILTFILYIINAFITFAGGAFALNSIIKSFRTRQGFKAVQFMLLIFISNYIYISFINNFYYEYYSLGNAYYEARSGYGETFFSLASTAFFLPFMFHLIINALFHEDKWDRVKIILAVIPAYLIFTTYSEYFVSTGFTDYSIYERYIFGISRYLDPAAITRNMPAAPLILNVLTFIFALVSFASSIALFSTIVYSMYKKDNINSDLLLKFSIVHAASVTGLITSSIIYAESLNDLVEISNVHIDFNTSLLSFIFHATIMLAISIVIYVKDRNKKNNKYFIINNN